jgi:NAD(P)H-dependent FMN reductase
MSLKLLVFLGSVRDSTPPRPARLGARIARVCQRQAVAAGHDAEMIDPLDYALPAIFKPHFTFPAGQAPRPLEHLAAAIGAADGYVMVSPEYNHSMSPALAHLLNHFGSSLFSYKPSLIVTYSAGQWGGVRAAAGMRSFLAELGCLPVSAMVHVPKAQEVLAEDGHFLPDVDATAWENYVGRALTQLAWWGAAARAQRLTAGAATAAFVRDPSQRNAP